MSNINLNLADFLLLGSIILHLFLCPFTKVEESFNMQAMNDVLTFGPEIQHYDHLLFPGVVPRTFIGPLIVSIFSYLPSQALASYDPSPIFNLFASYDPSPIFNLFASYDPSPIFNLFLCRGILAILVWISFVHVRQAIGRKFGTRFHIPFYSSRSLPNTFALIFANHAFASWLKSSPVNALCLLGISMVIFRCDMLILLGPMALVMLLSGEINFLATLRTGILVCVLALLVTVLIDSFFWRRWLWPEGIVFYFNGVENKSSEWGVLPWHWYFTSAIPRALHLSLPFSIIGFTGLTSHFLFKENSSLFSPLSPSARYYLAPYLLFVILYSILPHKELRFIFPIFAPLTLSAALGLHHTLPLTSSPSSSSAKRSFIQKLLSPLLWLGLGMLVVGMILVTMIFSVASMHNYPGGDTLSTLHEHLHHSFHIPTASAQSQEASPLIRYTPQDPSVSSDLLLPMPFFPHSSLQTTVCANAEQLFFGSNPNSFTELKKSNFSLHIDAASAIAGITRFQELPKTSVSPYKLHYSKDETEHLNYAEEFDWLIRGLENTDSREHIASSFDQIFTTYTFSKFLLDWNFASKPSLSLSPSVHALCLLHGLRQGQGQASLGDGSLPLTLEISFLGPLSMQFKATHGIYRNKIFAGNIR